MSGLETTVASAVQDVLIDDLQLTPKPGASYLLSKTQSRFHPAGSNIYHGTKVIRQNLTADATSWMNPQSCRLQFDIVNNTNKLGFIINIKLICRIFSLDFHSTNEKS